jgi:hypothetical protein
MKGRGARRAEQSDGPTQPSSHGKFCKFIWAFVNGWQKVARFSSVFRRWKIIPVWGFNRCVVQLSWYSLLRPLWSLS